MNKKRSKLELALEGQFSLAGLPDPEKEYAFMKGRGFLFDFAYPNIKMAVEVEGGIWIGGRHTTGEGFTRDCIKYNNAECLGWHVIRVTKDMIYDGDFLKPSTAMSFITRMYKYLTEGVVQDGKEEIQKSTVLREVDKRLAGQNRSGKILQKNSVKGKA